MNPHTLPGEQGGCHYLMDACVTAGLSKSRSFIEAARTISPSGVEPEPAAYKAAAPPSCSGERDGRLSRPTKKARCHGDTWPCKLALRKGPDVTRAEDRRPARSPVDGLPNPPAYRFQCYSTNEHTLLLHPWNSPNRRVRSTDRIPGVAAIIDAVVRGLVRRKAEKRQKGYHSHCAVITLMG